MSPNPTTINPLQNGSGVTIGSAPTLYLGPNTYVVNDTTKGLLTSLPLTTQNVLTSQAGLNINSSGTNSSLTIDSAGNIITAGAITSTGSITSSGSITVTGSLNPSSLNVGGTNFTVSNTGKTTMLDDLVVGSHFTVTKSTGAVKSDGNVTVGGTVYANGTVTIGGTQSTPNLTLGNDGHITASNDVRIGNNSHVFHAGTGNADITGSLNVHSNQLLVDSVNSLVAINCATNIAGDVNVNSGKFTVDHSTGNAVSTGTLSVANNVSVGGANVVITASSGKIATTGDVNVASDKVILGSSDGSISAVGNLKLGSDFTHPTFSVDSSSGVAQTTLAYSSYVPPSASTNTTTTSVSGTAPDFTSSTSQYLATQTYVDQQLWNQTVRINTILGDDNSVLDSFNNVYNIVKAIEGSTTASDSLTTIASNYGVINTSVSELAGNALNSVLVNCSSAVWGDECAPLPIPSTITGYPGFNGLDGWYFENVVTSSKVNWYVPSNNAMTIADFINIYMNVFVVSNTSLPMISIFTKPKGVGHNDIYPGFANARINYLFNASDITSINQMYCMYIGANAPENNYGITSIQSKNTITANSTNNIGPNYGNVLSGNNYDSSIISSSDIIQCFAIQSQATAVKNGVKFVLNSFNVQQNSLTGSKGTTQMLFQNSSVATNYMFNTFFQKNSDFSAMNTKNKNQTSAYNLLYNAN
jgi:hypothetical protein